MTADEQRARVIMASVRLGAWMSAALDDPKVCEEMKADIREWFSAGEPQPGWCAHIDEQRGGWRDIATAPKDGTIIDLWSGDKRYADYGWNAAHDAWVRTERMWRGSHTVNARRFLTDPASHWMPLPAPPSPSQPGQHDAPGMGEGL